jgi:PIN domain nuclease of toxin-antitoxin system
VKYLLDTHTFLWWVLDDPQLSQLCRDIIGDGANSIFFSAASAWEIAIKCQLGKLPLPEPSTTYVPTRLNHYGFIVLPITVQHTLHTYSLPLHHRDPFDRILAAQSQLEDIPVLTIDSLIARYGVRTLW